MKPHFSRLALILLFATFNVLARTPVVKDVLPSIDVPSPESRRIVTEAWSYMNPSQPAEQCDYEKAHELNMKAYELGHAEGASNIGLLYENGWGVKEDLWTAEKWYLIAQAGKYHSAQAELGLARVILRKPHTKENLNRVAHYIEEARRVASEPRSMWRDEKMQYEYWASVLEVQLNEARQ